MRTRWPTFGLAALLAGAPGAALAADTWLAARSPHFLVISNAGERGARKVAHQFEQLRGLFENRFQARLDSGRPFVILAVKDEASLKELAPGYWERKGGSIPAGLFAAGPDKDYVLLRLDVVDADRPYQVIYHEYVHFVTSLGFRSLPLWLMEGLAEFYGATEIDEKKVRWGLVHPWHLLSLRNESLLPMARLLAADHSSPLYNERNRSSMFYAQSALLTHYLILGSPERRGQLAEMARLLSEGVPAAEALPRTLGDPQRLEGELQAYAHRVQFPAVESNVALDPQTIQIVPLSRAEADSVRGDFLARSGRAREARKLLEQALAEAPDLSGPYESLGLLAMREGRRDEAARQFARSVELLPQNYLALYHASTIPGADPMSAADRARRERGLRRVIELNPQFSLAHDRLARLLLETDGSAEEALTLARRACEMDPASVSCRLAELRALQRLGRADEARRAEASLLQVTGSDPAALAAVVSHYLNEDRPAEAEAALKRAHEANPQSAAIAMQFGSFLRDRRRFTDSEAVLKEALRQQPDSAWVQNNLAYALAEGDKAAEALPLADKALKREPQNVAFLDTRGWALFKLNRLPEAEECLRKALQSAEDPDIQAHLGDVLLARGNRAGALEQWRSALTSSQWSAEQRTALEAKVRVAETPSPAPSPP